MTRAERFAIAVLTMFLATNGVRPAFAGGEGEPPAGLAADDVAVVGPAASFDNRLPPVIPGEEIRHNGRRTKVWSTSGPVPVGQVPQAPPAPGVGAQTNYGLPANMGIIVDNRADGNSAKR